MHNTTTITQRDAYRVNFKQGAIGQYLYADGATDTNSKPIDQYNPIQSVETSPLSFVTKDDDSVGVHMATVKYTVKIPE